MKLALITKFILRKRTSFLAVLVFITIFPALSQQYKYDFKNTPVSDALNKASDYFGFKIAFNVSKTDKLIVNKEVKGNTPEEFITDLLVGTPFDFVFKHGSFLIVDRTEDKTKSLRYDVMGSVSDNETGEKLPFASIYLPNQKNNLGTAATESGTFSIRNIGTNPVHLVVNLIGYFPVDTVFQYSGNNINCDLKLKRKVHLMDSVVVKQNKLEMVDLRSDADFATTINPAKLIDLPTLAETDVFRALQLLPGIKYSENTAELSIRGGSSDQNLVLFDGQTLYNLSHYYGVVSLLNPNVIKDIQVFKGGYDSRYGERVSGIVDITGKSGNNIKPVIYGDLNLISGNLTTEIPIGRKITLVAAARRSYSDIYATSLAKDLFKTNTFAVDPGRPDQMVIESTPSFYFFDYNTKLTYQISNKENISLSYFGGKDYFTNDYEGSLKNITANTTDKNNWSNYGISALWAKQWNGVFYSSLQIGQSGYTNNYNNSDLLTVFPGTPGMTNLPDSSRIFRHNNQNDLTDFSVNLKNNINLEKNQLSFGVGARENTIYFHKDFGPTAIFENVDQKAWSYSSYIQDRIAVGNKLSLKPGVRFSFNDGTQKVYFEPRFSANYKLFSGISLRVATGRYYQFASQVLVPQETSYSKNFWILANDSLSVVKSDHYIAGTTLDFGNFLIDAEAYYKDYSGIKEYYYLDPHIYEKPQNVLPRQMNTQVGTQQYQNSGYFYTGHGKMYGLDFMIRYKQRAYTGWISYSLSRSLYQFKEINSGNYTPAPTDQIHQLSFTNMVSYRKWNFGSTILFNTGKPYIYDSRNNLQTQYYKRLPNYFRTDISANYNFQIKNLKMKVGAGIINLFNTQNYYDVNNKEINFENGSVLEKNLIRLQDLSLNLFLHFQL